jgi:hypothetical protein
MHQLFQVGRLFRQRLIRKYPLYSNTTIHCTFYQQKYRPVDSFEATMGMAINNLQILMQI